jgi:hypothetical protein
LAQVAKACKWGGGVRGGGRRDPTVIIDGHFFLRKYMSVPQNLKNIGVNRIFQRKEWYRSQKLLMKLCTTFDRFEKVISS